MKKVQYYVQPGTLLHQLVSLFKCFNLEPCYIVKSTTTIYPAVYVTVRVQEGNRITMS